MTVKIVLCVFLTLTTLIAACTPSNSASTPEPDYWPTTGWKSSTPEAQGMDSAQLASILENISVNETSIHSVLIVRNGYLVTEAYFHPYTRDSKMHIRSSPIQYVTLDAAPFLILHGEQDAAVPVKQAHVLYQALSAVQADATLVLVQNANHNFKPTGGQIHPTRTEISAIMGDFFDRILK